jgi:hypothetical protein
MQDLQRPADMAGRQANLGELSLNSPQSLAASD